MFKQISHQEAEKLIKTRNNLIIADVRDEESFEEGHISKAAHLSMAKLVEFCERFDKKQPILLYCYHGISSQAVAKHLVEHGFAEVYSLVGGFETWKIYHPSSSDASH